MKTLYNKKGLRRGAGERHSFAFFAAGAAAVLAVVFVIGLQVGRVVEKEAARKEVAAAAAGGPIVVGKENASEIGREIGSFAQEAEKLPAVPPPTAEERVRETERSVTFLETLEKKNPEPARLSGAAAAQGANGRPAAPQLYVQAAAFRDRGAAERMRRSLERAGYPASLAGGRAGREAALHRVLVGPYAGKKAAARAMEKIAAELRVKPFLVRN